MRRIAQFFLLALSLLFFGQSAAASPVTLGVYIDGNLMASINPLQDGLWHRYGISIQSPDHAFPITVVAESGACWVDNVMYRDFKIDKLDPAPGDWDPWIFNPFFDDFVPSNAAGNFWTSSDIGPEGGWQSNYGSPLWGEPGGPAFILSNVNSPGARPRLEQIAVDWPSASLYMSVDVAANRTVPETSPFALLLLGGSLGLVIWRKL